MTLKNATKDHPFHDVKLNLFTSKWAKQRQIHCEYFQETTSTHEVAKKKIFPELSEDLPFALVLAEKQTTGRGRNQNTWTVENDGSCLLSTWCYDLGETPHSTFSMRVGLSLYRAVSRTWPYLEWSVKAPNDLYLEGNKIAGLLTEIVQQGDQKMLLISLGMNVLAAPESIQNTVCLVDCIPTEYPFVADDWVSFLDQLSFEFTECLFKSSEELNFNERYSLLYALNENPNLESVFLSLDEKGNLKTKDNRFSWTSL